MKKINTFFIGLVILTITSLSLFGFYQKWIIMSYEKTHFKHSKLKPNF